MAIPTSLPLAEHRAQPPDDADTEPRAMPAKSDRSAFAGFGDADAAIADVDRRRYRSAYVAGIADSPFGLTLHPRRRGSDTAKWGSAVEWQQPIPLVHRAGARCSMNRRAAGPRHLNPPGVRAG